MGQMVGKNIIIDDRVKGKISISSARKVPLSEAYNVMKAILEVKGLAIVETENLIKILPIEDAVKKNTSVIVDGKSLSTKRPSRISSSSRTRTRTRSPAPSAP